jgi:hypothetical protein
VGSHASDIVQGYATLASSLLERWSSLASSAADKLDAGEYDFATAAEDLSAGASLATEGAAQWAAQTLKAATACTGFGAGSCVVKSEPFRAPAGATLRLAGPLTKGPRLDELPVGAVRIEPSQLGPTETEFTLTVDATGHRGATYVGKVEASTETGSSIVTVWVTVP